MTVSLFPTITATTGGHTCPLTAILDGIRSGQWAAAVAAVRSAETKTERRLLKSKLPYFTVSGTFDRREDRGLIAHSGFVALDIDGDDNPGISLATIREKLTADPYTHAGFVSAGGNGYCSIVRIPAEDHAGSFRSLQAYYLEHHGLHVDSLPDVSRPRFISYDPDLYHNPDSDEWQDVLDVPKPAPKVVPASTWRPSARGEGYGQDALARAVSKVLGAGDHHKHITLNKMAFLCGGYVASGFLSFDEARHALGVAIGSREVADLKNAHKTIEDGLAAGLLKPILPDALQYAARHQLRNGGTAATVSLSISASQGIPADAVSPAVQAVADELTAGPPTLQTFWDIVDPGKDKPLKVNLSLAKYGEWLGNSGFRQRTVGEKSRLVRLDGNIVRPMLRSGLKAFVLDYLEELPFEFDGIFRNQLEEIVRRQHFLLFEESGWEFLPFLPDDFVRDTEAAGRFFYRNGWVEVTQAGVALHAYAELPGIVWESQLIARPFTLHRNEEVEQAEFFRFLWNIAGHKEDRLHGLLLFIGYYLHTYKDPSTPKIGVLVDEIAGTEGQANGGTGKSLLMKAIGEIVEVVEVDGKGFDPRNTKALQQVSDATRVLFFNDWDTHRVPFDRLYNMASDTLIVDRLYTGQQSYKFDISPKLAITTNGVITGKDSSDKRRKYELEIAPHYSPTFQPRDEFGHNFFSGWDATEWARFDNLMLYACHLFLKGGRRLVAPASENLERRRLVTATSSGFVDFMDGQPRGVMLYRTELLTAFRQAEGYDEKSFTPERFGRWLGVYRDLSTDFQSGQERAGDFKGGRWIMLAKDKKQPE